MRPIDLSGTYTRTFRSSASTTCPESLTLTTAEAFAQVGSIRRPHADIAMRFPAAGGLTEDGAACTGGGLIAVTSLSTYDPTIMAAIEQPDAAKTLVLANDWARRMTHWADVVGLGLSTWTCGGAGGGTPRWAPTQWAALGESDWFLDVTDGTDVSRVEIGGGNRSLVVVTTTETTGTIDCVLAAPPRRVVADAEGGGSPVGSTPGAGGESDTAGVSGAAAAGIAVAAAVAAAALTAALVVAIIVVRQRRRRGGGGTAKATGSGAPVAGTLAAADGGGGGDGGSSGVLPSPLPSLVGPPPAAGGWVLPTYGDGGGGVGTVVKPPWGLGESLALPPPMPEALRETADSSVTTETPSSGRRDTSSAAHSGRS